MKTYFKLELKKAIFSWRTIISILIILAVFILPCLEEIKFPYPGLDGIGYFIRLQQDSYIGFIGPVVAGLIYSTSIIKDKESGFIDKLLEIIDIKTYFKVKLAVNTLANSIIFAVSYSILILYLIVTFGISNEAGGHIVEGPFIIYAFIGVYKTSKILYITIIFLGTVLSAAAFSIFMLGITTASNTKFTSYIFPVFYIILTGVFFQMWFLNDVIDFNIVKLFDLTINNTTNGIGVILYDSILVLLGILLLYKFGYKRILYLYQKRV